MAFRTKRYDEVAPSKPVQGFLTPCLLPFGRTPRCPSCAAPVSAAGVHNLSAIQSPLCAGSRGTGSLAPNMCLALPQPLSLFPRERQHPTTTYSLNNPLAAWPNELLSHGYFSLEICQRRKDEGWGGCRQTKLGAWVDRGRGKEGEEWESKGWGS